MRAYPRLAAIALAAGVVTPRLAHRKRGKRARGERAGDYSEPKRCPDDIWVFLEYLRHGWYYCPRCGQRFHESELP